MTAARAPGKVMVAGEYAVLHGAPSVVLAVNRHAVARVVPDAPAFEPPEALAAFALAQEKGLLSSVPHVYVDNAALNRDGRKLGLGSSAAGCVAALGAALRAQGHALEPLRETLGILARRAHRAVQGGGSGVDVLSATWGGLLRVELAQGPEGDAAVAPLAWPAGLRWSVLWTGVAVRTSELLGAVRALHARDPGRHDALMGAVAEAARGLVRAFEQGDAGALVLAARAQQSAMDALGIASGRELVTEPMRQLGRAAEPLGAAVKPSGAGGGDVVLLVGHDGPGYNEALARAVALGFVDLELQMDEHGVCAAAELEDAE